MRAMNSIPSVVQAKALSLRVAIAAATPGTDRRNRRCLVDYRRQAIQICHGSYWGGGDLPRSNTRARKAATRQRGPRHVVARTVKTLT
jgi:hypothetical protein